MEREFLVKQGLKDDQVKAVMSQYGKDVTDLKAKAAKADTYGGQVDDLKSQISDRDKQLKDLNKQAGDDDALKSKIAELEDNNKQAAKDYEAKLAKQNKDFTISKALSKAGALENKAVIPFIDMDKVSVDKNGNLLGFDDQLEAAKKEHGFLFKQEKKEEPKPTPHVVPAGNGTSEVDEKKPSQMSLEDQNKMYQKDPGKWRSLFKK